MVKSVCEGARARSDAASQPRVRIACESAHPGPTHVPCPGKDGLDHDSMVLRDREDLARVDEVRAEAEADDGQSPDEGEERQVVAGLMISSERR